MKAVCPINKNHKEFITTAQVIQDWKVDEKGELIKVLDQQVRVSHSPNIDNLWYCAICNAYAKVE